MDKHFCGSQCEPYKYSLITSCLCTNPFSPASLYTSPCSGYKESSYQQMDWGELGSCGQEGCQAMLVHVLVLQLCLSVFLSFLQCQLCGLVCFSFVPSCATTDYSYVSPDCFVVGAVWSSFSCSVEDSGRNNSVVTSNFLSSDFSSSESSSGPHLARPLSCM